MERASAVVLACLCCLAGCSAVPVGAGGSDSPEGTETLSPVSVPEQSTATERLAPGLTRQGIVDPLALVDAHRGQLARSYRFRANWSVRYANGSLYGRVDQDATVGPGTFRAGVTAAGRPGFLTTGPPVRTDVWSNGSVLLERYRRNGTVGYRLVGPAVYRTGNGFYQSFRHPKPFRDRVTLFGAIETRVAAVRTERSGPARYTVVGERLDDPDRFAAATNVRQPTNVSLRAVIDERGLVRSFQLSYDGQFPSGETVHVSRNVTYRAVGSIDRVPRPAWEDRAVAASGNGSRDRIDAPSRLAPPS